MNVLVCGGAGYVGSHAVMALRDAGHTPIVLDSLEKGHRAAVRGAEVVVGNILDHDRVLRALRQFEIHTVMHFCAYIEVGESMSDPMRYYANNTMGALSLLKSMRDAGVGNFIFSSTAAVYGMPEAVPIPEDAPARPINPYGHSKLLVEEVCRRLARHTDFRYAALRYFNACGASADGLLGEDHRPESHLIPIVLQVPAGKRPAVRIYGRDYPTPDGACVRDYIHVADLARAHVKAMDYLAAGGESGAFNLGTGQGYSVLEIVDMARKVTGHPIPAEDGGRRPGDPPRLVADPSKARRLLGWEAVESDLETIIASAWKWHQAHPDGYAE